MLDQVVEDHNEHFHTNLIFRPFAKCIFLHPYWHLSYMNHVIVYSSHCHRKATLRYVLALEYKLNFCSLNFSLLLYISFHDYAADFLETELFQNVVREARA